MGGMNTLKTIKTFNAGRDAERLSLKYAHMRTDPFVFLRGTCHLFYDHLSQIAPLPTSPSVWVCGDLHLENFGSFKGDNRLSYFDINDFDETALAPASWDVLRFLTSLRVGAQTLGINPDEVTALCHSFLSTYANALVVGKSRWLERDTADGAIGQLLKSLRERRRVDFLDKRTERDGKQRQLRTDGKKALKASDKQRLKITGFMDKFASQQPNPEFYRVLDVARRIAGTGSLGVARYVVLVEGKGSPDGNFLLDLKQALPSSLASHVKLLKIEQPSWQSDAHRVVTVQNRAQAVPMAFLQPVRVGKMPYVLRDLQPVEDRLALSRDSLSKPDLRQAIDTMANVLAWGQLRTAGFHGSAIADTLSDFGRNPKWPKKLLSASADCAVLVTHDWVNYAEAFDEGYFKIAA